MSVLPVPCDGSTLCEHSAVLSSVIYNLPNHLGSSAIFRPLSSIEKALRVVLLQCSEVSGTLISRATGMMTIKTLMVPKILGVCLVGAFPLAQLPTTLIQIHHPGPKRQKRQMRR